MPKRKEENLSLKEKIKFAQDIEKYNTSNLDKLKLKLDKFITDVSFEDDIPLEPKTSVKYSDVIKQKTDPLTTVIINKKIDKLFNVKSPRHIGKNIDVSKVKEDDVNFKNNMINFYKTQAQLYDTIKSLPTSSSYEYYKANKDTTTKNKLVQDKVKTLNDNYIKTLKDVAKYSFYLSHLNNPSIDKKSGFYKKVDKFTAPPSNIDASNINIDTIFNGFKAKNPNYKKYCESAYNLCDSNINKENIDQIELDRVCKEQELNLIDFTTNKRRNFCPASPSIKTTSVQPTSTTPTSTKTPTIRGTTGRTTGFTPGKTKRRLFDFEE